MQTGEQLKLAGMAKASRKHNIALDKAQRVARIIGRNGDEITSDEVKTKMEEWYGECDLGNAAGAIFPASEWECVGWVKSKRPSAHGRFIRQWRMRRKMFYTSVDK